VGGHPPGLVKSYVEVELGAPEKFYLLSRKKKMGGKPVCGGIGGEKENLGFFDMQSRRTEVPEELGTKYAAPQSKKTIFTPIRINKLKKKRSGCSEGAASGGIWGQAGNDMDETNEIRAAGEIKTTTKKRKPQIQDRFHGLTRFRESTEPQHPRGQTATWRTTPKSHHRTTLSQGML